MIKSFFDFKFIIKSFLDLQFINKSFLDLKFINKSFLDLKFINNLLGKSTAGTNLLPHLNVLCCSQ